MENTEKIADAVIHLDSIKGKEHSLTEQVASKISQLIIDRHLTMTDKLPNEFELMEQLNVGRGTVREAVKLLVARNVLEIRRGKGTFVAKHIGVTDDPLGFAYMQDQVTLARELLEIRVLLEPWAASLAAQRATDNDVEGLKMLASKVEELIRAGENHLAADEKFHVAIARCTQNRVMPKLIPIITYSVQLFGNFNGTTLLQETIATHHKILAGIASHDSEAARLAMIEHLIKNRENILAMETSSKNAAD
ncbi:MAG: FadR/GntR family transcriptional regulator [Ruthenibacterium sp.]